MLIFGGKSKKKLELFEDLFPTSQKIYNHFTDKDRIHYFHSLMRADTLQTFINISSPAERSWQNFCLSSVENT